jgi:PPOX class probable FMN-dependent enzyme
MPDTLTTIAELEALYGQPVEAATVKEVDRITPHYRAYIEASPFATLATSGPEGLDCSPRGDKPGFMRVAGEKTLMLPDRRGNNRIDSLRNIVRDPRVALLFLIPGVGNTLRVNGRAHLSVEPDLLASFSIDDKPPRSVTVIEVDAVYFQCARALVPVELVAVENDDIVGHILFSVLATTIDRQTVPALALAPMAVRPDRQRRGIGSALVRAGLDLARDRDWRAIIVLGHKGYYPRFGFSAALARPLEAPFSGDAFMALELAPDALRGEKGRVTYPPAFGVTND